jgi:hypothetical protein
MSVAKTLRVGGVAVATLGLSTCSDGGAVDPAPSPLDCATVKTGQSLSATGTLNGQALTITITDATQSGWAGTPSISAVTGGTLGGVTIDSMGRVVVSITTDAPTTPSGSFTLTGALSGGEGETCPVTRTFDWTNQGSEGVIVSMRDDDLPLGARGRASIVVMRREGREVELHAAGATGGAAVGWTATGGAVDARAHDRVTWRLPEEPGLYQIELLVDRGREGLCVDTLTLEVG